MALGEGVVLAVALAGAIDQTSLSGPRPRSARGRMLAFTWRFTLSSLAKVFSSSTTASPSWVARQSVGLLLQNIT